MEVYIVRPGDSLWSIAGRYGTSAEELARINQLNDRSRLVPKLALVESSRISTFGRLSSARAMHRRCFWPPETFVPPRSMRVL